jgi:hypothetical protein
MTGEDQKEAYLPSIFPSHQIAGDLSQQNLSLLQHLYCGGPSSYRSQVLQLAETTGEQLARKKNWLFDFNRINYNFPKR